VAETIQANAYRRRIAKHMADNSPLPPFAFIAFGDGGHNADLTPKVPDPDAAGLAHEVMRKPLASITQPTPYLVECAGRIEPGELTGVYVSEAALLDADGQIVALKTFAPKIREADEMYQVFIEPRF